jgi:hypothetical protein
MNSRLPEDTQCIALVITQAQATSFMRGIGLSLQSFTFNGQRRCIQRSSEGSIAYGRGVFQ